MTTKPIQHTDPSPELVRLIRAAVALSLNPRREHPLTSGNGDARVVDDLVEAK
jgi:hypothetical protein